MATWYIQMLESDDQFSLTGGRRQIYQPTIQLHPPLIHIIFPQPIPLELNTIYSIILADKEINCVSFSLAPLPFLIFM